ncbi:monovalent cation/H(+) antiporter subunit G [Bacillus sp. FJAT-44742]|uniref:monovalent cation/H(+) antiporter subunit G n=1 Tax=Bacillus sp. FJAT-44742 TaxID=2014005 RepID=UPI000C24278F|nr:monovalent cation/H(+) antiporter subunit G [Bacillus sp. FJAT-44742]
MTEVLISIFVLIGAFFSLLAAIGIIRMPDVYGRLHAATKSATLGVISLMTGTFLYFLLVEGLFVAKFLLVILFVFLTAPLAAQMISRSAHRIGVSLWEKSSMDELEDSYPEDVKKKRKQQTS